MNRITELRRCKKVTQEELAKKLDLHQTAVSQWETDRTEPSTTQLKLLAKFFGVTIDYLLGMSDNQFSTSAPTPEITALNEQEQKLVDLFRELSPTGQESVLAQVAALRSVFPTAAGNTSDSPAS